MSRLRFSVTLCLFALLLSSGSQLSKGDNPARDAGSGKPTSVNTAAGMLRVSGPYTHGSLSVFLLHAEKQDEREFLTLDRGLKDGVVKVTELEKERVGELKIDNGSNLPLYLQEGERLVGGKQDRIIAASLVLPAKSGPVGVPTFCIEQSRWQEGDSGRKFGFAVNPALAPKGVRGAAKFESSQDRVWKSVKAQKDTAKKQDLAPSKTSSANELLDAPKIRKISDDHAAALASALRDQPDAVGVAVALGGLIEEVNLYPNHALFSKLYPRLVQCYAVQAQLLEAKGDTAKALTPADIAAFIKAGKEQPAQTRKLNASNEAVCSQLEEGKFQCLTRYEGRTIHFQMMKKNAMGGSAAARFRFGALGSDW